MAITAAMAKGTGLAAFQHRYPTRFFDVGIAEQHAVTFAAGLAAGGLKPVVAIYSTFMQRAVDQVIHDVALQRLPVIFALDRSGAVPDDGETHQGLYDIALFRPIPGVSILCPASAVEMKLLAFMGCHAGYSRSDPLPEGLLVPPSSLPFHRQSRADAECSLIMTVPMP